MSGAWSHGKGDRTRAVTLPWEVRGLEYDRSMGKITQEEYDERIEDAWKRAKKRGWRGPRR